MDSCKHNEFLERTLIERELLELAETAHIENWRNQRQFRKMKNRWTTFSEYCKDILWNIRTEFVSEVKDSRGMLLAHHGNGIFTAYPSREGQRAGQKHNTSIDDIAHLQGWIIEGDGHYFWITKAEEKSQKEKTFFLKGYDCKGKYLDRHDVGDLRELSDRITKFKVVLFGRDFKECCRAAKQGMSGGISTKLSKCIANPINALTLPSTFVKLHGPESLLKNIVPANSSQQIAILESNQIVTVIQGPPGTGKSTTIFHICKSKVPKEFSSLVTCVTNQAIDAVVEKLSRMHAEKEGLRILVMGNPKRLGINASLFTLEELVKRDELVISTKNCLKTLESAVNQLSDFQTARRNHLFGNRKIEKSRFSGSEIIRNNPAVRYEVELCISESYKKEFPTDILSKKQTLEASDYRYMAEKLKCFQNGWKDVEDKALIKYLERLNSTREAMIRIVLSTVSSRCGKNVQFPIARLHTKVKNSYRLADERHTFAKEIAPIRVVRETKVFLGTVISSSSLNRIRDKFNANPFREKCNVCSEFPLIHTAILDEAAATPERYMPVIVSLNVENLICLGDHKQLPPIIKGNKKEIEIKRVNRSYMERCVTFKQQGFSIFLLKEQYRMPVILANIVSKLFYNNMLKTADKRKEQLGKNLVKAKTKTKTAVPNVLFWHEISKAEEKVGTSSINREECKKMLHYLLSDPTYSSGTETVFVMLMYRRQKELLLEVAKQYPLLQIRLDAKDPSLRIITVDASQGSEADHILLGTTRCGGDLGFLSDPRRLNVAISRAKKTLTIFGNTNTLKKDKKWRSLVTNIKQDGCSMNIQPSSCMEDKVDQEAIKMISQKHNRTRYNLNTGRGRGRGHALKHHRTPTRFRHMYYA